MKRLVFFFHMFKNLSKLLYISTICFFMEFVKKRNLQRNVKLSFNCKSYLETLSHNDGTSIIYSSLTASYFTLTLITTPRVACWFDDVFVGKTLAYVLCSQREKFHEWNISRYRYPLNDKPVNETIVFDRTTSEKLK